MDVFTYLMAKKGHNTHKDLFSYLLGRGGGQSGTYTTFSGTSLNISNSIKAQIKNFMLNSTELTQDGTPTTDSPVDVNVIKDSNNVKIENKNILDMTYALVGYSINATTGLNTEDNRNACGDNYIPVLPNTKYTFSVNVNVTNIRLSEYQNDKSHIQRRTESNTNKITITTTSDTYYLRWSLNKDNQTITQEKLNELDLQLEQGNEATTYVPHQEQNYSINLIGKNLFDYSVAIYKNGYFKNDDGIETTSSASGYTLNHIKVNPNTEYTLSGKIRASGTGAAIYFYDSNKNWIERSVWYSGTSLEKFNFVTPNNCYFIQLQYTMNVYDETTVQIEKGTEATTYKPYKELQYCKIGDYADQIFKNTINSPYYDNTLLENEWYLKKNIWKIILDGTESGFNPGGIDGSTFRTYLGNTTVAFNTTDEIKVLCNYLEGNTPNEIITNQQVGICTRRGTSQGLFLRVPTTIANNLTSFLQWLGTVNPIVYYILETPQYIHISETDYPVLKQELENLYNNAKSYNEQTVITQTNDDLPFNISVDVLIKD